MSPGRTYEEVVADRFPRVSGDEPVRHRADELRLVFSPRERG